MTSAKQVYQTPSQIPKFMKDFDEKLPICSKFSFEKYVQAFSRLVCAEEISVEKYGEELLLMMDLCEEYPKILHLLMTNAKYVEAFEKIEEKYDLNIMKAKLDNELFYCQECVQSPTFDYITKTPLASLYQIYQDKSCKSNALQKLLDKLFKNREVEQLTLKDFAVQYLQEMGHKISEESEVKYGEEICLKFEKRFTVFLDKFMAILDEKKEELLLVISTHVTPNQTGIKSQSLRNSKIARNAIPHIRLGVTCQFLWDTIVIKK